MTKEITGIAMSRGQWEMSGNINSREVILGKVKWKREGLLQWINAGRRNELGAIGQRLISSREGLSEMWQEEVNYGGCE